MGDAIPHPSPTINCARGQASGATAEEVECFTQSLRDRINQLKTLPDED